MGINTSYLDAYVGDFTEVINFYIVPFIFTLCVLVFLWGVAKTYIFSGGNEGERKKGHQLILWGIIGFAVMLSVWGLVNLLLALFGLTAGGTSPAPPTIQLGTPPPPPPLIDT